MTEAAGSRGAGGSAAAIYILMSVMFVNIIGFGIVVPLLPFYAKSFNAAPWQIGLVFSAYSIGTAIGEPFLGRLSDRIGRRPILIVTTLANGLCYGSLAFAPNVLSAVLIRLVGGLAAGNGSAVQGYIADKIRPEDRAPIMARLGVAYNIGFILGPFVGGVLAKTSLGPLGFRIPLLVAGSCGLAASLGVTLFVRESRVRARTGEGRRRGWVEMLGYVARHPVLGPLVLLTFAVGFAFTGIESTFGLWTHQRFNWIPRDVGLAFGVSGVASAITNAWISGGLSRRFGEANMLAVGMAGTCIAMLIQPFTHGAWDTYAALAFSAMCSSVAFPNAGAMMSQATDEDHQGQVMGLNNAAGAISRILGPQAAGFMFAFVSLQGPFFLAAAIVAPAIFLALAAGRARSLSGAAHGDSELRVVS